MNKHKLKERKIDKKPHITNHTSNNKGITLVALIITIIVLLILAVVAIRAVQGDGIISKAKEARDNYGQKADEEQATLGSYLEKIEANIPGASQTPTTPGTGGETEIGGEGQGTGTETGGEGSGEGTDNPASGIAPTIVWEANPAFAPMAINDNLNADLVVNAPEKIASFKMVVDSPYLGPAIEGLTFDGTTTMDLINDESIVEFMGELGTPAGTQLLGAATVDFIITRLVEMISLYGPEAGTEHKFNLIITDEKGKTIEKTLTFVSE